MWKLEAQPTKAPDFLEDDDEQVADRGPAETDEVLDKSAVPKSYGALPKGMVRYAFYLQHLSRNYVTRL